MNAGGVLGVLNKFDYRVHLTPLLILLFVLTLHILAAIYIKNYSMLKNTT
jgi:hypothetical protein